MGNGPENQGGWQQAEPTEPPADLLRRALSHVEDLLGRLEYPAVKQGELESLPDDQTGAASAGVGLATDDAAATAVLESDPELHQVQSIARRIQDEARATADAILAQARRDAQLIRGQGRADAEQLAQEAALEAERTLAEAQTVAEQRVAAAHAEADQMRAAEHAEDAAAVDAERARARELVDSAGRTLQGIRTELRVLAESLSSSLSAIESSSRALDALLAAFPDAEGNDATRAVASYSDDDPGPTWVRTGGAESSSSSSTDPESRARSPLGQLFGAGRR